MFNFNTVVFDGRPQCL